MADRDMSDFYLSAAMNAVALFFFVCVPLGCVIAIGHVIAGWDGVAGAILVMLTCLIFGVEIEIRRLRRAARK